MVPVFGLLVWLAVRIRRGRLRAVAAELAVYAAAGWLGPAEVPALASMPARSLARALARRSGGRAAGRAVARYEADATALALLRHRARRGGPAREPDFVGRERELLHRLWQRRATAGPALARAAVMEELLPPWFDPLDRGTPDCGAAVPRPGERPWTRTARGPGREPEPGPDPVGRTARTRPARTRPRRAAPPDLRRSDPWTPATPAGPPSSRPCALPGGDGGR